jgi:GNAT superfamily N-acetyltransferase
MADDTLVTVATFENSLQASLARGALEAEGIDAFVPGDTLGTFTRNRGGVSLTELQVRVSDRERAAAALARIGASRAAFNKSAGAVKELGRRHRRMTSIEGADACAPLVFRPARVDEKTSLEALQWRASVNNPGDREAILSHPDAIEIPVEQLEGGLVFVAESAGVPVGFAAILTRDDGDADLDALFVEPHMWRQGYGKALIAQCLDAARQRGARALHVIGNPHAEGFYLSCGFELIGTEQTRFGPGLLMCRRTD